VGEGRPGLVAGACLILLATLAVYAPVLGAGFIWDDDQYVENNRLLRTPAGLATIWLEPRSLPQYYPLVHTSYWLEYRLWQLDPRGYHLTNVILHALAAIALWRVALRLALPGAFLAGALFALHPVAVESVAWIAERKNTLSTLLYLVAALTLLPLFGADGPGAPHSGRRRLRYVAGALLFGGALLAKTVTASLPAALLVVEWWRHGRIRPKALLSTLPLFVIGLTAGLTTVWLERHHVGAVTEAFDIGAGERLLIAGRAVWFYATKIICPVGLSFVYPRWEIDATSPAQWLFPIAAGAAVLALWVARHRIGRGPLATTLLFGGTLLPVLGFFDVYPMKYSFVADHFQYLAILAPLTALGALIGGTSATRPARVGRLASAALLVLLGSLTLGYVQNFDDRETLWRHTLTRNPTSALARTNLGALLLERAALGAARGLGDEISPLLAEAEGHLEIASMHAVDRFDGATIQRNLGHLLILDGRVPAAIAAFRRAAELNPWDVHSWLGLADALERAGDVGGATDAYRSALAQAPDQTQARAALARLGAGQ